ncbi:MAG: OPT/YSL family transporter [Candidatus Marinimicrobia bacterium]|nr:OPT/YSL family transporter [Candidatus Neomarinimicrobiota bacterium]
MLKATITAIIIAVFLFFTSAYIALKMGALPWPIIFSIIVSAGLLRILGDISPNKVNIAQAGGSIGGLMAAAVVFTLPGMILENLNTISFAWLALIAACGAVLGVGLSIPLREEYVIKRNLAFPAGRAGGELIKAGFNQDHRFGLLVMFGVASALFTICREAFNWNFIDLGVVGSQPILILIMPMVIATGLILGSANSFSWGAGGILSVLAGVGFMKLLPESDISPMIQNFGMGLVIGSGIGYILMHAGLPLPAKSIIFRHKPWVWSIALLSGIILFFMGIPLFAVVLCLLLTFFTVNLASRMTGMTNIDPLEQFGLLSALLITFFFGLANLDLALEHRYIITFFIATATAIAGDIGHDYKSAQIVHTDYKKIVRVDIITGVVVALFIPALLWLIKSPVIAEKLFTSEFPAPQAQIVSANLSGLSHPSIFIAGLFIAVIIEGFRSKGKLSSVHLMPLGIGLFLGFNLAFLIAMGGLIALRVQKKGSESMLTAIVIAAAILGGEGTVGFLQSIVKVFSPESYFTVMGITALLLIALLARSIRGHFQK